MTLRQLQEAVREYAQEHHPDWTNIGISFRCADEVLGFLRIEPETMMALSRDEIPLSPLSCLPTR